jgi:hypothetical protein
MWQAEAIVNETRKAQHGSLMGRKYEGGFFVHTRGSHVEIRVRYAVSSVTMIELRSAIIVQVKIRVEWQILSTMKVSHQAVGGVDVALCTCALAVARLYSGCCDNIV